MNRFVSQIQVRFTNWMERTRKIWMLIGMVAVDLLGILAITGLVWLFYNLILNDTRQREIFKKEVVIERSMNGMEVDRFTYNGHEYLNFFWDKANVRGQLVHNPDCPCGRKDEKGDL